jgi:hypothetical protein
MWPIGLIPKQVRDRVVDNGWMSVLKAAKPILLCPFVPVVVQKNYCALLCLMWFKKTFVPFVVQKKWPFKKANR